MEARGRDPLVIAGLAFLAANAAHTLDHFRTGTERLTTEVVAGGTVITALALLTLGLALRRHPRAPLAAALTGFATAAGVAASHIAPHWSAFSDPYPALGADALSWVVMLAELGAALALGVAGLRAATPAPRRAASTAG
jgi:hypothetical protein